MPGLFIDSFVSATVPLADGNLVPVGQGTSPEQTTKADIVEIQKYIQRKFSSSPNNMLGGNSIFINGTLTVTSAANNLTVAVKTLAGNDPSITDPVFIVFRSTTLTTGDYVIRTLTAAVSFTVNSPNTLGISTGAAEVFIVGIDDTGPTFRLGLVNPKISATQVYVPDEWILKSATTGNGGNSAGTIYSSATVTNRPIVNLGFMRWSNFVTPGTWTLPTSIQRITSSSMDARLQETVNDYLSRLSAKADLASPTLTGTPAAPTAVAGNNSTQIATTAFVATSYASLASPALTGTPTAPTAVADTSTTQIASTAYVLGQAATAAPLMAGVATIGISTRFARQDHIHPTDTSRAPLASPTLTGAPAAPTAAVDTNTTQLATTAFVLAQAASVAPLMDGVAAIGTSTRYARQDHVHPTDTTLAPLASPALTGAPTAPTALADTNTTQLATTAFVLAQAASVAPLIDGVAAVGTSSRFARQDHVHPTDTSRAPVASPTFTGTPAGPTAAAGTSTTQLATTAFVATSYAPLASPALTGAPTAPTATLGTNTTQIATTAFVLANAGSGVTYSVTNPNMDGTATPGTATTVARSDHTHPTDTSRAPLASPTFTGTPAAPTAAAGTSTTQLATTAFVVTSYAPLASAALTGTPTAPTAAVGTNTTQIATTAFVLANSGTTVTYSAVNPTMNGTASPGVATTVARSDHVHPTDTSLAPLASPTLTGTPAAPTAAVGTNTTQLATTAYVIGQAANVAPVMNSVATIGTSTRYARQDHVHPTDTTLAPIASPGLTGTPTAPTAALGTNTTQIATTAFVIANSSSVTYSVTNPVMDGTATPGTATTVARSDHAHPTDTSRAPLASPTFSGTVTFATNFNTVVNTPNAVINFDSGNDCFYYDRTNNIFYHMISSVNKLTLTSAGDLTAVGNVTAYSDPRLKTDISPINDARALINRLQGYRFTWNDEAAILGKEARRDIGLLSNEVREVLPELVGKMPADKNGVEYETVAYDKVVSVLVCGFNELDTRVTALENKLADVLKRLDKLEAWS